VELFLDGRSLGRQQPDKARKSTNLKHPPFTFHVKSFTPGVVTAVGYKNNKKIIQHQRKTPGAPAKINLHIDYSGKDLKTGQNDIVFVYADVVDENETVVHDAKDAIEFTVTGDTVLVGQNPRAAEAGTATVLLKAGTKTGNIKISARCGNLKSSELTITAK